VDLTILACTQSDAAACDEDNSDGFWPPPPDSPNDDDEHQFAALHHLVELYVTANMLLDTTCQNKAIDAIASNDFDILSHRLISYVWDHTTRDAPLRNLFMDHLVSARWRKAMQG
jgi:hypothetical protein